MDFLVEMTTHVPPGISQDAVDDMLLREAARARELAAEGHLLRLWRPPLAPGQWRTLGLFAADEADQLEQKLTSMPLRIWRTDTVTQLAQHPNDPGLGSAVSEFLTTLTITVPSGTKDAEVDDRKAREAVRAAELAGQGRLLRLWTPSNAPGVWRTLGLWGADDQGDLMSILQSLPLYDWMTVDATPLLVHPSDPANGRA
ncbi:MAG TPA: muconolactone Delta-isomerase family protein [Mycobacterium sp.]|jgi:muconolactone delta-isomerase|nr:muconolactone Delta-isomerase family protein [Mycobacterium sp.]